MALFYFISGRKSVALRDATAGKVDVGAQYTWAEHMGPKINSQIATDFLPASDHLCAHIYRPESGPEILQMATENFWREYQDAKNDLRKLR